MRIPELLLPACCLLALATAAAGCSDNDGASADGPPAVKLPATRSIPCAIGTRPGYFVPGADDRPNPIVGCARLGVSRTTVEFSLSRETIGRRDHLCVNPAYPATGKLAGTYIPAHCLALPVGRRLDVVAIAAPSQGRSRERVVWGTVGEREPVVVRAAGRRVEALRLEVGRSIGRRLALADPVDLFVVELPRTTACAPASAGSNGAHETIPPRPGICDDARLPAPAADGAEPEA